jgi:hypothetical protein
MESLPKAMTFVHIFSCSSSTPLISKIPILEILSWVSPHVKINMNKELCEVIPNISKTPEIWKNPQTTNSQSHNSDIHGSTANYIYLHKFYNEYSFVNTKIRTLLHQTQHQATKNALCNINSGFMK